MHDGAAACPPERPKLLGQRIAPIQGAVQEADSPTAADELSQFLIHEGL
jgi:hypothetical protein